MRMVQALADDLRSPDKVIDTAIALQTGTSFQAWNPALAARVTRISLAALMISSNADYGSKWTEIGRCTLCGRFFELGNQGEVYQAESIALAPITWKGPMHADRQSDRGLSGAETRRKWPGQN